MTLTTLITLNAVVAAVVLYGLLWLLVSGIASGRVARRTELRGLPVRDADRIAA